jgi:hypothetical protein
LRGCGQPVRDADQDILWLITTAGTLVGIAVSHGTSAPENEQF